MARDRMMFPLGKTGGLIEAVDTRRDPPCRSRRFPLGKTGGLIEAVPARASEAAPWRGFRWVKPAASLKQLCAGSGARVAAHVSAG